MTKNPHSTVIILRQILYQPEIVLLEDAPQACNGAELEQEQRRAVLFALQVRMVEECFRPHGFGFDWVGKTPCPRARNFPSGSGVRTTVISRFCNSRC